MTTGETLLVALTVDSNVLNVAGLELLHVRLDGLHATIRTGSGGGNVGVETSSVPFTLDGLGLKGNFDTELLSDTVEEETGQPKVVTHLNACARANLVLPLGRHDLGVDTRDLDTSIETGTVVGLDDVTAVDLAGTDTTVVRALSTGETALGPSVGPAIGAEKGVFLFKTEPELLLGMRLHQAVAVVTVVELVGGAIGVPGLTENKDVVATAEGIGVNSTRAKVDI